MTSFDWDGQQAVSREWRERMECLDAVDYLQRLEKTGWLQAIGQERAERLRVRLGAVLRDNPAYSFYELADTEFDTDCIEEAGTDDSSSYYAVVMQLAHDSSSLFRPSTVHDELDREAGVARVAFDHDGKHYECEVDQQDEWFKEPVLQLVNAALADSGVPDRFIDLPACNQTMSLALVPEEIYTAAVEAGLIPDVSFYSPGDD